MARGRCAASPAAPGWPHGLREGASVAAAQGIDAQDRRWPAVVVAHARQTGAQAAAHRAGASAVVDRAAAPAGRCGRRMAGAWDPPRRPGACCGHGSGADAGSAWRSDRVVILGLGRMTRLSDRPCRGTAQSAGQLAAGPTAPVQPCHPVQRGHARPPRTTRQARAAADAGMKRGVVAGAAARASAVSCAAFDAPLPATGPRSDPSRTACPP